MMNEMDRSGFWGFRIGAMVIGGLLLAVLIAFLFGYFVQLLWNWLMPGLFGLSTITYWQGFGLVLLARMLFGGWGRMGHGRPRGVEFHGRDFGPIDVGVVGRFRGRRGRRVRYGDWWHEEGKAAFEAYVARRSEAEPGAKGPSEE